MLNVYPEYGLPYEGWASQGRTSDETAGLSRDSQTLPRASC